MGKVEWNYLDSETGDELWIGFHGYGQDARVMHHFLQYLKPNARVISFDLPLHGETKVYSTFLRPSYLSEILGPLLKEHHTQKCSLVGFSLGGKMVLKLIELVPGRIDKVVLIAPDGLRINPIYWLATNTLLGRICFKVVIRYPQPILAASLALNKLRLLHEGVYTFVYDQMKSQDKRQRVFDTWQMFKKTTPKLKDVRGKIARYHIKTTLVFGKYDRVIHPKLAKKLSGDNCKTAEVIMLDVGHKLLTREIAENLNNRIA